MLYKIYTSLFDKFSHPPFILWATLNIRTEWKDAYNGPIMLLNSRKTSGNLSAYIHQATATKCVIVSFFRQLKPSRIWKTQRLFFLHRHSIALCHHQHVSKRIQPRFFTVFLTYMKIAQPTNSLQQAGTQSLAWYFNFYYMGVTIWLLFMAFVPLRKVPCW